MKLRLTYREFSILAGILVAAIILFILWLHPISGQTSVSDGSDAYHWIIPSVATLIDKARFVVQLVL